MLASVLADIGEELPSTRRKALSKFVWNYVRLRLGGMNWTPRDTSEIPPRDLLRLDCYLGVGLSLAMVDTMSGAAFQARGLVYAVGGPAVLLGGPIAGRLSNRFGRVALILAGSLLMALMQVLMPFSAIAADAVGAHLTSAGLDLPTFGSVMWPVAVPSLLLFFVAQLAGSSRSAPFQTLALEVCDPEKRGALSAIQLTRPHWLDGRMPTGTAAQIAILAATVLLGALVQWKLTAPAGPSEPDASRRKSSSPRDGQREPHAAAV